MAWIQDSIMSEELNITQPGVEGKAEVLEVYATHEGSVAPGQVVPVGAGLKNTGGRDNIRFVVCFLEPYLEGAPEEQVFMEKIEEVWPDNEVWISGTLTVPADYTGATITLVAIGYHEE